MRKHSPDQIIPKLRAAEVELSGGLTIGQVCQKLAISENTSHRCHRAPVLDYRCPRCGAVFNAFTGTALAGTHRRPAELVLILRGVTRGEPTARLARELGCSRRHLLELRHKLHHYAERFLPKR